MAEAGPQAEKVGRPDAEGKNLAVGSSLPPDLSSQVAALESPEEVQEGLLAGPCNVNVRKLLPQESLLLEGQRSCLPLKQGAWGDGLLGLTVFAS